ncbi:hypothetical protein BMT55_06740 [Listeria newyorkensis]|uniref:Uncharacterized protein n=1 Tax=Listeria newyorkensis TaxID=1497681 RepID=A0ABX4XPK1_9LIST|nr:MULTISPECIES: hypothetical protein [Listeria]KGL39568.1 hypothetical protein EP56_13475 [Listeriaceae bacterium FSL A5-0209]KGL44160.1 hypothetical protein EP58_06850 [Listeria newyorkensis]PNP93117.1 hypothetical protein BMT55_06740 [Listeria newyorkensis]RQW67114.1 hypothetical protein DUK53_07950 [Listeria sp. SHR_NRA_18]SQC57762.1 Uncharacterised protein [Listeria newyorkensis]
MSNFSMVKVNGLLEDWAKREVGLQNFTVEHILSALSLPDDDYEAVFLFLRNKVGNELELKKMLLCPDGHKNQVVDLDTNVSEIYTDCMFCEEEDYDPFWVFVFSFSDNYQQDARKHASTDEKKKVVEYLSLVNIGAVNGL